MSITYQDAAPTRFQAECPHRLRNKANTECSSCGSRKAANGKWEYLTLDWHKYYQSGLDKPNK